MGDEVNEVKRKLHNSEVSFLPPILRKYGDYRASVLSLPSARQPTGDIPAGAGFLCDKADDVLRATTKWSRSRNILFTSFHLWLVQLIFIL
jgi:hypothetical protein